VQSYAAKPQPRFGKKYLFWIIGGVIGLYLTYQAAALVIVVYLIQPVRVEGIAMSPALHNGDKVFMLKRIGKIQRGEIVVHLYPEDTSKSYIKRIVGLPGETLEIRAGRVFINGQLLEEPYLQAEYFSQDALEPVQIAAEHYFVLGDNRRNSSDSRYWGTVPRKLIYGKYWYRYWEAAPSAN
jgi:signal peptidase I